MNFPIGEAIGRRYRILKLLGTGVHGTVYKVLDTRLQRIVALKLLRFALNAEAQQVFLREAVALVLLKHPNLVQVYDADQAETFVYQTFEYIEGRTLRQIMADAKPLDPAYAIEIVRQVGAGLEYAHLHGVIHRDVKPSNILISNDGRVLLADFGLAIAPGLPTLTQTGTIAGTPAYMSPEQVMGKPVDARSDIFSLGVVLYELLTGRKPFSGESTAKLFSKIVEEQPASTRQIDPPVPASINEILLKSLAKEPGQRFQSAHDFLRALAGSNPRVWQQETAETMPLKDESAEFGEGPPHAKLSDSRVSGRTDHVLPTSLEQVVGQRDLRDIEETAFDLTPYSPSPTLAEALTVDLTFEANERLREFDGIWELLTISARHKEQFVVLSRKLVLGLLREAIGYSVEAGIPFFQGTVGYMVEAPLLWIRHSRFPILFVAYDQYRSDTLETVQKQLQIAKATEFFALLVVVPTTEGTGREATELRRLVAGSVYRYDFVVLDQQSLASIIAHNSSQHLVEIILEQGIELSSLSPYVVKGPVSEKMFFGREKEIKTVTQGIQRGDYAIVGGRRIGKSSTLQRVNRLLNNDPRCQPLYMDCEEKFNYEDLFQALAEEFGEPLDGTAPVGFKRLVKELKIRAPARQVVFLLDEVDALLAFDAESKRDGKLFKTFRTLSHEGLCRFVFSGSRTLYRHLHDPHSPFFNFCEDIVLKPLEQKSIVEIVSKPMHQMGIELPEEEMLIDRIIDLSSSHPNIAQWICDRLIKTASARRITLDSIENISADPEFCRHYVETAWSDSTPLEKLISLAVDGPSFQIEKLYDVLAHRGLTDKTMIRKGVEMLQLCALFEREGQRCRFALTHFPRMVRQMEDVTSQIEWLLGQVVV